MNVSSEDCVKLLVEAYKKKLARYAVAKAFGNKKKFLILGSELRGYREALSKSYNARHAAGQLHELWMRCARTRIEARAFLLGIRK